MNIFNLKKKERKWDGKYASLNLIQRRRRKKNLGFYKYKNFISNFQLSISLFIFKALCLHFCPQNSSFIWDCCVGMSTLSRHFRPYIFLFMPNFPLTLYLMALIISKKDDIKKKINTVSILLLICCLELENACNNLFS